MFLTNQLIIYMLKKNNLLILKNSNINNTNNIIIEKLTVEISNNLEKKNKLINKKPFRGTLLSKIKKKIKEINLEVDKSNLSQQNNNFYIFCNLTNLILNQHIRIAKKKLKENQKLPTPKLRSFIYNTWAKEYCQLLYILKEEDWDYLIGPDIKLEILLERIMNDPEFNNHEKIVQVLNKKIKLLLEIYIKNNI